MEITEHRQLAALGVDLTIQDEDAALISAARGGDVEAKSALYNRYAPRVYRFARGFLLDDYDAEQATQETFAAIFGHLDRYDAQRGSVSAWLFGTAYHCCQHLRRTRGRWWKRIFSIEQASETSGFDLGHTADYDLSLTLKAALEHLDPMSRAIVLFTEVHGYTYDEVATILGCPIGTVSSRRHRALRKLRRELGDRS